MQESYFQWMVRIVDRPNWSGGRSWERLLRTLDEIEFSYILELDANRADDGIDLRYRFGAEHNYNNDIIRDCLDTRPCSMLEMMIALACRCEEHIMDDPDIGDRTGKWFFEMIGSLGLEDMDDRHFDKDYVIFVVNRLLHREYEPDGRGGLFTIPSCRFDLRKSEIWYQMMWYLTDLIYGGI